MIVVEMADLITFLNSIVSKMRSSEIIFLITVGISASAHFERRE
jgi:hypothetical protein